MPTFPTPRQAYFGNPAVPGYEPVKADLVRLFEQVQAIATTQVLTGFVGALASLPTTGNTTGDTYAVMVAGDDGGIYEWSGTAWVKISALPATLTIDEYAILAEQFAGEAEDSADAAAVSAAAAQAAAAGVNLPSIGPGDARKILFVNPGATGYDLLSSTTVALFANRADLLQDSTVIGYEGSGAEVEVLIGDTVLVQGRPMQVVAGNATGFDAQTAGGVRLIDAGFVFSTLASLTRASGAEGDDFVQLTEAGRDGFFRWLSPADATAQGINLTALVTADPQRGLVVAGAGDATGASGVWRRQYQGEILVTWFGASPAQTGTLGNTTIYNGIISACPAGAVIRWPKMAGPWIGSFVSSKPFWLKLGDNQFQEVDRVASGQNLPVFKFQGSKALFTTLTANAIYGQKTLTLTTTVGLTAGSIIELEDQAARGTDSALVNQEILRVAAVTSGTVITVEDMVRSYQDNGTRNVYLITPIVGAIIEGGRVVINNPYMESQLGNPATWGHFASIYEIEYGERCEIIRPTVRNHYNNPARLKECIDSKVLHADIAFPSSVESGAGYGPSCYIGRDIEIGHFTTRAGRNGFDFDAVYNGYAHDGFVDGCGTGGAIAHNGFGGNVRIERVRAMRLFSSIGFGTSVQGRTDNASKMILRDITVRDCFIDTIARASDPASGAGGAFIGISIPQSWAQLHIENITINTAISSTTPANNAIVGVRIDGYAAGPTVIRNVCQADPTGTADTNRGLNWIVVMDCFTTSLGANVRHHLVVIEDCNTYWGQGVVWSRGIKHLATKNLTMQFLTAGGAIKLVQTANGVANETNVSLGVHAVIL